MANIRQLHKVLGYYVPAFFEMHVKIDSYELTFNKLSPTDATIFFHEYIHFLQYISTYYGLNRIYVYSELLCPIVLNKGEIHLKKSTFTTEMTSNDIIFS